MLPDYVDVKVRRGPIQPAFGSLNHTVVILTDTRGEVLPTYFHLWWYGRKRVISESELMSKWLRHEEIFREKIC